MSEQLELPGGRVCSVDGCGRAVWKRGFCSRDYWRAKRSGELVPLPVPSAAERFAAKTVEGSWPGHSFDRSDRCRLWTGSTTADGYGKLSIDGRDEYAHRFAWESAHGPIPEGFDVHHRCRTRRCVNSSHLELLPHAEHTAREGSSRPLKTHCKRGHEFTPENTYRYSSGWRECRTCRREYDQRRRAAAKAAA